MKRDPEVQVLLLIYNKELIVDAHAEKMHRGI